MSVTVSYAPTQKGKTLALLGSDWEALQKLFGQERFKLQAKDIPKLEGYAASLQEGSMRSASFRRLIEAIHAYDEVEMWGEW